MFITQEELEKLIDKRIEDYQFGGFKGMYYRWGGATGEEMLKRIEAFESYLGIHYEENTTKGYVKNKKK